MKSINLILIIFVLLGSLSLSIAQNRGNQQHNNRGIEKIKAIKIGLITEELNLSETQAIKFWPVYNAFTDKKQQINKQIRILTKSEESGEDNEEILKNDDEILKLKQKEIELIKSFRDEFLKVISVQQYVDLQNIEKKFNKMLLDKLKERKNKEDN